MGVISSGGLSTSEKLASANPTVRREGQRELSTQSTTQQQTTTSTAKKITSSGYSGTITTQQLQQEQSTAQQQLQAQQKAESTAQTYQARATRTSAGEGFTRTTVELPMLYATGSVLTPSVSTITDQTPPRRSSGKYGGQTYEPYKPLTRAEKAEKARIEKEAGVYGEIGQLKLGGAGTFQDIVVKSATSVYQTGKKLTQETLRSNVVVQTGMGRLTPEQKENLPKSLKFLTEKPIAERVVETAKPTAEFIIKNPKASAQIGLGVVYSVGTETIKNPVTATLDVALFEGIGSTGKLTKRAKAIAETVKLRGRKSYFDLKTNIKTTGRIGKIPIKVWTPQIRQIKPTSTTTFKYTGKGYFEVADLQTIKTLQSDYNIYTDRYIFPSKEKQITLKPVGTKAITPKVKTFDTQFGKVEIIKPDVKRIGKLERQSSAGRKIIEDDLRSFGRVEDDFKPIIDRLRSEQRLKATKRLQTFDIKPPLTEQEVRSLKLFEETKGQSGLGLSGRDFQTTFIKKLEGPILKIENELKPPTADNLKGIFPPSTFEKIKNIFPKGKKGQFSFSPQITKQEGVIRERTPSTFTIKRTELDFKPRVIKPEERTFRTIIPRLPTTQQVPKIKPSIKLDIGSITIDRRILEQKPREDILFSTKQILNLKRDTITEQKTRQAFKLKQSPITQLDLKLKEIKQDRLKKPFRRPTRIRETKIPREFKFSLPDFKKKYGIKESFTSGFNVEVKRFGKWLKISKQPLSKESALSFGARKVSTTAGATFRIKKAGFIKQPKETDKFFRSVQQRFRKPKGSKDPFTFVEKSKFRITSLGEKQEITFKGIETKKKKKKIKQILTIR